MMNDIYKLVSMKSLLKSDDGYTFNGLHIVVDELVDLLIERECANVPCTCGFGGDHVDTNTNCERANRIMKAKDGEYR